MPGSKIRFLARNKPLFFFFKLLMGLRVIKYIYPSNWLSFFHLNKFEWHRTCISIVIWIPFVEDIFIFSVAWSKMLSVIPSKINLSTLEIWRLSIQGMMAYGHMNMIFYMLLKIWFTNHSFPSEISVPLLWNLLIYPGVVFSRLQTRSPNLLAQASFITADSILVWL